MRYDTYYAVYHHRTLVGIEPTPELALDAWHRYAVFSTRNGKRLPPKEGDRRIIPRPAVHPRWFDTVWLDHMTRGY